MPVPLRAPPLPASRLVRFLYLWDASGVRRMMLFASISLGGRGTPVSRTAVSYVAARPSRASDASGILKEEDSWL